jgi:hypothetical protein
MAIGGLSVFSTAIRQLEVMTMAKTTKAPDLALWTAYRVRWEFITRICASVPADPGLIQKWLETREPSVRAAGARSIEEINEEVLESLGRGEGEPDQSFSMLVFQKHDGFLVQRAATVKAHVKDCGAVISAQFMGRIANERSFAVRVKNGVYLDKHAYWLPILRPDGTPIAAADGAFDKAIHVRNPRGGSISALKRFEYIDPPAIIEFTLNVLGRSVSETDLHHLFEYGGTHGYAGERGDGEGRYDYTLERIDADAVNGRTKLADAQTRGAATAHDGGAR